MPGAAIGKDKYYKTSGHILRCYQHRTTLWEGLVRLLMKKETWKFILQTLAAILTAIATTLGVESCMG